jgi:hypothetical protein
VAVLLATGDELTAWAGSVDPTLAGLVLAAVSGTAIRLAQPVSAAWTSSETVPDEVKGVVLQVAARVVGNPSGYSSESLAGYSFAVGGVPRGVVFTDDERYQLLEAAGLAYEAASDTVAVPLRPIQRWARF